MPDKHPNPCTLSGPSFIIFIYSLTSICRSRSAVESTEIIQGPAKHEKEGADWGSLNSWVFSAACSVLSTAAGLGLALEARAPAQYP